MIECKRCASGETVKSGTVRGKQRYLCKQCGCHFVEGDQRENKNSYLFKILCELFQILGVRQYRTVGKYLERDTSLIHRWMNMERFEYKHRQDYSTECYDINSLFEEIRQAGVENGNPMFFADNIIDDDLYIAVIVQRREKR